MTEKREASGKGQTEVGDQKSEVSYIGGTGRKDSRAVEQRLGEKYSVAGFFLDPSLRGNRKPGVDVKNPQIFADDA